MGIIAGRDDRFRDQYLSSGRHCTAAVFEDFHRALVVPIVNDLLYDVGVTPFGHAFEKIADHELTAWQRPPDALSRRRNPGRKIVQHARQVWIPGHYCREQLTMAASHINEALAFREIVRLGRRHVAALAQRDHGALE